MIERRCKISNYEKNARIIHEVCSEEELESYFKDPNDAKHIVNVVLDRVAETLHDNPTLSFAHFDQEDIRQQCWLWSIETLMSGKYNCKTSLFGYLHKVCINKIFKLKRDKQWRSDISDQKQCKQCKHRETCSRKIQYSDLDHVPKCKVMAKALIRNSAKHALSTQADYDITEPESHTDQYEHVDLQCMTEFFENEIPDKYKPVFERILHEDIKGIPKHTVTAVRRWCWRIMRKLDPEKYGIPRKTGLILQNYRIYQREDRQKRRQKNKAKGKPTDGLPHKNAGYRTGRPVGRPKKGQNDGF